MSIIKGKVLYNSDTGGTRNIVPLSERCDVYDRLDIYYYSQYDYDYGIKSVPCRNISSSGIRLIIDWTLCTPPYNSTKTYLFTTRYLLKPLSLEPVVSGITNCTGTEFYNDQRVTIYKVVAYRRS